MCLHTITSREPEECGVGYKVFVLESDGNLSPIYQIKENYRYRLKEWISDPNQFPLTRPAFWSLAAIEFQYETGFHLFLNLDDAEALRQAFGQIKEAVVVKVRYRKAVVEGGFYVPGRVVSSASPCVVAKEMFIQEIL